MLAQEALLFPHLTVRENVAFAPRSAGAGRREAYAVADRWLGEVDATELGRAGGPGNCRAGRRNGVAIARGARGRTAVLLLDEPMAALDVGVGPAVRALLRRVLRTGDRTRDRGHPRCAGRSFARRPGCRAGRRPDRRGGAGGAGPGPPAQRVRGRIAGINLMAGKVRDGFLDTVAGAVYGIAEEGCTDGESAVAVFSPTAVAVHRVHPEGSPRNALPGANRGDRGSRTARSRDRVRAADHSDGTAGRVADVTAAAVAPLDLAPGDDVWFAVKAPRSRSTRLRPGMR